MLVKQAYQLTNFRLKLFLLGTIPFDHSLKYDGKNAIRFYGELSTVGDRVRSLCGSEDYSL